jgi:hypothetical protein
VRAGLELDELDAFDLLRQSTVGDPAIHDEGRHVDTPDVIAEILDPGIDAIERALTGAPAARSSCIRLRACSWIGMSTDVARRRS